MVKTSERRLEVKTQDDLYEYATLLAKRNMKSYAKDYNNNAMDYDDLVQEAKITTFLVIKKYGDKPLLELQKIVCGAVCNKLNFLRSRGQNIQKAMKQYVKFKYPGLEKSRLFMIDEDNIDNIDEDDIEIKEASSILESISLEEVEKYLGACDPELPDFAIESLKEFCDKYSDKEPRLYDILYARFVEEKPLSEIATQVHRTRQRVDQIIKQYLPWLKKYFAN